VIEGLTMNMSERKRPRSQHARSRPTLSPCTLSRTGWLADQPQDFEARMLGLGRWKTYRAGEHIYDVADAADAVYGLENGALDISIPISGDEMVTIHRAQPGFWIGDSALLSDNPRGVRVAAHTDSLVLVIPGSALRRHLADTPHDMLYLFRLSHGNMVLALQALAEVIALPPRARFASLLLRIASEDGLVRATQTEVASLAGMSRASFRRALAGLIAAGAVKTEYGQIRIFDRTALEREAAQR
jgi:CRP-like cAMP-binding protein